jgi:hypothetical protein
MLWMKSAMGGACGTISPMAYGSRLLAKAGVLVRLRNAVAPSASRRRYRSSCATVEVGDRVLFCSVLFLWSVEFRREVDRWQQRTMVKSVATLKVTISGSSGSIM